MTRAFLWVIPLLAIAAAWLGSAVDGVGIFVSAFLGIGVATALWTGGRERIEHVTARLQSWRGLGLPDRIDPGQSPEWRALATAANGVADDLNAARAQLRAVVPWTERLVASLDEPAYVFGPDDRLVNQNDAGAELSNVDAGAELRTPLTTLGSSVVADAVAEARATGLLVSVDVEQATRDLRVTASPLDEHVLVVVSDFTRERQIEALRRDFVVNASHELKTPVTAISMLTGALRVAPEDRRAGLVDRLEDESERLVRLVHDLLDLRMLDEGNDAEQTSVDLSALVAEAVASHAQAAERTGVTFDVDVPPSAVVVGVARELRLVVDNLVGNAVHYNRPGGTCLVRLVADVGEQVLTV